jgi:Big-like domain-containing protein/fibronectin type III domain protein/putative peptidoglycan binding protein
MKKNLLYIVIVTLVLCSAFRGSHAFAFSGGSGTSIDPYQITTCADFENVGSSSSSDFILENDIDCTGDANAISTATSFTGDFNGNGHKLTIAITTTGPSSTWAIWENFSGTLENLWVDGTVSDSFGGDNLSGLIYSMSSGTISNVKSTVTINGGSGSGNVGSLVSLMSGGTIENSYFSGSIYTGGDADGSLVGAMSGGTIEDSYAFGNVNGGNNVGGLVGTNAGGTISDSFYADRVTASGANAGGIVGSASAGTMTDDYWDVTRSSQDDCISGNATVAGCSAINIDEAQNDYFQSNSTNAPMSNWDFTNTWRVVTGGYPDLQVIPNVPDTVTNFSTNIISSSEIDLTWDAASDGSSPITGYEIERSTGGGPGGGGATFSPIAYPAAGDTSYADTGLEPSTQYNYEIFAINALGSGVPAEDDDTDTVASFPGGDGSSGDPYQITTCAQFEEMTNATPIGAHFALEKDLDCTGEGNAISITTFPFFMGRFDGQGHRITIATTDGEGLFHATGDVFVAKDLWVAGTITGATGFTGAVVDTVDGGTVSQVKSTVTITGAGDIGGIVGEIGLTSATVQNSYFDGVIHGTGGSDSIGGIVGRIQHSAPLQDDYSAGTITETGSNAHIGGIWGFVGVPSTQGTSNNNFSAIAMSATGTSDNIGGLFGSVGHSYSNNFWDVTATGQTNCVGSGASIGGCAAENTDGNSGDYFKNNSINGPLSSWDFGSVWKTVADAYPELNGIGADPIVTSVTPVDGSTGVSTTPSLVVNFSEPMDTSSVILESSPCGNDGCLSYNTVWSNGSQTVTLTPTTVLLPNTEYHVEVYSANNSGEFSLASPFLWSFTTGTPALSGEVGGGYAYVCTDPKATNYDTYPSSENTTCKYTTTSQAAPSPTLATAQPTLAPISTFQFLENLKLGEKSSDVIKLQQFLNANNDTVTDSGPGSKGHETTYFGIKTKQALIKYQKDHNISGTGFFGPVTRAYANGHLNM